MAKKNGKGAMTAFDWTTFLALLKQILDALQPKAMKSVGKGGLVSFKDPVSCEQDECCRTLLCSVAQLAQNAVRDHEELSNNPDATQEQRDRVECSLCCAAHALQCAVSLHQSLCHTNGNGGETA
jgi:class 3 adenylate cyclase